MTKTHFGSDTSSGAVASAPNQTDSVMNETDIHLRARQGFLNALEKFHRDESGVAMTEYIIIFTLISFGSTIALLATAAYIKAYRDFLVWWLGHPAV
jgi:Flp pilus assembly pilin Flp